MADPSSFAILEMTGQRRLLELRGRALPYRPYTLRGKQRAEFTWYPGNPTASVQLLGAKEEPTQLRGQWKDRYLRSSDDDGRGVVPTAVAELNGSQLADVHALVTVVDSMRRAGQLLEVTWDEQVRRGILTDFSVSWNRREWAEWEMEFTWQGQGEEESAVAFATAPDALTFTTRLSTLVSTLREKILAPFQVVQEFKDELTASVEAVESAAAELVNLQREVADAVFDVTDTIERTLAAAVTVRDGAADIVALVISTPPRAVVNVVDSSALTLGEVLEVDVWTRGVKQAARDVERLGAEQSDELEDKLNQTDLLAAFVARQPMDLRDVSQTYYGSPDEWRRLLKYNNLASSKLLRGALVLVPKIQFQDRSA